MRRCPTIQCICAVALVLAALTGYAGAGVLQTDTNSMAGWRGSVHLQASFSGRSVNVDLDYAVYAPNPGNSAFDATFGPGADPSGGTEYVYAYQIFNRSSGSSPVTALSVGLDGDETFAAGPTLGRIGFLGGTIGVSPTSSFLAPSDGSVPPTSARWAFSTSPYLPVGQNSKMLLFTSPGAPEWDSTTIMGRWSAVGQAPSPSFAPIPEPATLTVLTLGGLGLLCGRRRFGA